MRITINRMHEVTLYTRKVYKIDAQCMALKKNDRNFHPTRDTVDTFSNEPISYFRKKNRLFLQIVRSVGDRRSQIHLS